MVRQLVLLLAAAPALLALCACEPSVVQAADVPLMLRSITLSVPLAADGATENLLLG